MKLPPQQRLAASRRAIVQSMHRDQREHRHDNTSDGAPARPAESGSAPAAGASRSNRRHPSGFNGLWRVARRSASGWWRSQPASLAVDVVQPMVENYARANPLKLIGLAAGAGALVIIAKPWRLISVTGVLLAALRSTQMSELIASFLAPPPTEPRDR
jgi:hypothetical protein